MILAFENITKGSEDCKNFKKEQKIKISCKRNKNIQCRFCGNWNWNEKEGYFECRLGLYKIPYFLLEKKYKDKNFKPYDNK